MKYIIAILFSATVWGQTFTVSGTTYSLVEQDELLTILNAYAEGYDAGSEFNSEVSLSLVDPITASWTWSSSNAYNFTSENTSDPRWTIIVTGDSSSRNRTGQLQFNGINIGPIFRTSAYLGDGFSAAKSHAIYEVIRRRLNEMLSSTGLTTPSPNHPYRSVGSCGYYGQCPTSFYFTKPGVDLVLNIVSSNTGWLVEVQDSVNFVISSYIAPTDEQLPLQLSRAVNYLNDEVRRSTN